MQSGCFNDIGSLYRPLFVYLFLNFRLCFLYQYPVGFEDLKYIVGMVAPLYKSPSEKGQGRAEGCFSHLRGRTGVLEAGGCAERAVGNCRNVVMRECFKTIKMKCTLSRCCCILRNLFHCECASCAYFYGYILCAVIA